MILIGSKPYKLELNNIIDNFEKLIRFNMAINNNNNGTKEPLYQIMNVHGYYNIINENRNTFIENYSHLIKKKHLEDFFDNKLTFDVHLIKLDCNTSWVEKKIIETVNLLRSEIFPKSSSSCEYCNYLKKRWQLSKN